MSAGVVAAAVPVATRAEAEGGNGVVGSYFGTVTATNPPLGQFNDLISFHDGGIVTESRRYLVTPTPLGSLLETSGHGAWEKTGGDAYQAFFRFFLQNADTGEPIGTDNVRLWVTLDKDARTLSGTFQSQIKDTTDTVLLVVTGDYSATPITV
jgi:hypothetical protein